MAAERLDNMLNVIHRRISVLEEMERQAGNNIILSADNELSAAEAIAHLAKVHRQLEDTRLARRVVMIGLNELPIPILRLSAGAEINFDIELESTVEQRTFKIDDHKERFGGEGEDEV